MAVCLLVAEAHQGPQVGRKDKGIVGRQAVIVGSHAVVEQRVGEFGLLVIRVVDVLPRKGTFGTDLAVAAFSVDRQEVTPRQFLRPHQSRAQFHAVVAHQSCILQTVEHHLLQRGVTLFRVDVSVLILQSKGESKPERPLKNEFVAHIREKTTAVLCAFPAVDDGGTVGEQLRHAALTVLRVAPSHLRRQLFLVDALWVRAVQVQSGHTRSHPSRHVVVRFPFPFFVGMLRLVHVVRASVDRQLREVVCIQPEEARVVAVAGAHTGLGVAREALVVLPAQAHLHDVVLPFHVMSDVPAAPRWPVIGLQLTHHVGRQVVEHQRLVVVEEVLAVQREVVHSLSVHVDVAVAPQLGPGQLSHERIEHRALGQIEGSSVVHDGVASVLQLHFRSFHMHFVQLQLLVDTVRAAQHDAGNGVVAAPTRIFQLVVHTAVGVAFARSAHDVAGLHGWYRQVELRMRTGTAR